MAHINHFWKFGQRTFSRQLTNCLMDQPEVFVIEMFVTESVGKHSDGRKFICQGFRDFYWRWHGAILKLLGTSRQCNWIHCLTAISGSVCNLLVIWIRLALPRKMKARSSWKKILGNFPVNFGRGKHCRFVAFWQKQPKLWLHAGFRFSSPEANWHGLFEPGNCPATNCCGSATELTWTPKSRVNTGFVVFSLWNNPLVLLNYLAEDYSTS